MDVRFQSINTINRIDESKKNQTNEQHRKSHEELINANEIETKHLKWAAWRRRAAKRPDSTWWDLDDVQIIHLTFMRNGGARIAQRHSSM